MRLIRLLAGIPFAVCLWCAPVQNPRDASASAGPAYPSSSSTPVIHAIINAASFASGSLAPGTLIAIDGVNLADVTVPATDDGVHSLPSKLGGVEVILGGIALPLLSVSPTEVRAQLPYDLANIQEANIYARVEHTDGSIAFTNAIDLKIAPATPGLFAFGGQEPRSGLAVHADEQGQAGAPVTSENPAKPGQVIVLWATGLGAVDTDGASAAPLMGVPFSGPDAQVAIPVEAVIAGRQARVLSAILPAGSIGVYEIRVLLLDDLPVNTATRLFIAQNGYFSNTVTFPVAR